jgi:very-short-patch-repair endonuclease
LFPLLVGGDKGVVIRGFSFKKQIKMDNKIKQLARNLRNSPTPAEHLLWQHLCRKQMQGYKFRRQEMLGNYIVDFICIDAKLIIELDGGQHLEQQEYDAIRTKYLESLGFYVMRFWNEQIFKELEAVKEEIAQYLTTTP